MDKPDDKQECFECGTDEMSLHAYYFRCDECKERLCRACALVKARLIPLTGRFHGFKTTVMKRDYSKFGPDWTCVSNATAKYGKKCMSIEGNSEARMIGVQRWTTDASMKKYLCLDCCLYYGNAETSPINTIMG